MLLACSVFHAVWSQLSPCVRGCSISQQCCIGWISSRHAASFTTETRLFKSQLFTNFLNKTLKKTLIGIESSVIPLQLSSFCRLSFLGSGSLTTRPLQRKSWMVFSSTHLWRSFLSPGSWVPVSFEHLHKCYVFPGAFPFFKKLIWWHWEPFL